MLSAMFYIGSNVMDWPLEAQRAVADGMLTLLLLYSKTFHLSGHEICIRKLPS